MTGFVWIFSEAVEVVAVLPVVVAEAEHLSPS